MDATYDSDEDADYTKMDLVSQDTFCDSECVMNMYNVICLYIRTYNHACAHLYMHIQVRMYV